ncbi:MAG TPA: hypothetical protein ENL01_01865 [Chlorobaculum parvum]|uniref:Uncharacterized protein n=1 Tax=Chlorobaculum parvum TaxID=274539 RepID=A0A7C5H9W3_9CHLB|nr:hypothetical protein [Chlorobaculum parvum]
MQEQAIVDAAAKVFERFHVVSVVRPDAEGSRVQSTTLPYGPVQTFCSIDEAYRVSEDRPGVLFYVKPENSPLSRQERSLLINAMAYGLSIATMTCGSLCEDTTLAGMAARFGVQLIELGVN